MPRKWTTQEVAAMLGKPRYELSALARHGCVPGIERVGRVIAWSQESIDAVRKLDAEQKQPASV